MGHRKLAWPPFQRRQSVDQTLVDAALADPSARRTSIELSGPLSDIGFEVRSSGSTTTEFSIDERTNQERSAERVIKGFLLSVVADCMDELYLLRSVYTAFVENVTVPHMDYEKLEKRFGQTTANYAEYRIGMAYTDLHKIQKEIAIMIFLLEILYAEAYKYSALTFVNECMNNMESMKRDEEVLTQELHEKVRLLDYIRFAIVKEKQMSVNVENAYNNTLRDAIRAYQDQTEYALAEVKYVKKWQGARFEQNKDRLKKGETTPYDTITHMRWKYELEERCHDELKSYIAESQAEYMDQIQTWMENYETALENKESDIYNLKMERENLIDRFVDLNEEYHERARKIEEYLEYKAKKAEEAKLLALQIWAATKIQAWWRGIMMRRHLGPYSKKAKKGKDKGKGKGKAKKGKK